MFLQIAEHIIALYDLRENDPLRDHSHIDYKTRNNMFSYLKKHINLTSKCKLQIIVRMNANIKSNICLN